MSALRILSIGCRLVLVLSLFVLAACSDDTPSSGTDAGDGDAGYIPPDRQSRTFTSQADWESGSMSGLNPDATGSLQMNAGLALFETPFMWVPNSTDRTVSKIDTKTMEVLGTFDLVDRDGEWCYNPSRTTVDIQGNVWVGCRGNASYINRSAVTAGMVPATVDNKIMKISGQNGSILISRRVGHAPRSLSLDANNHLWVGCSVDDTVWEVDGDTGACYRGEGAGCPNPAIPVDDFPYGSVVDQRGHLWIVHNRIAIGNPADLVTEINTQDGLVLGVYGPYDREGCMDLYGIAVDQLNNIWLGGFACDDVLKIKGTDGVNPADGITYATGELIGAYLVGGSLSRGVAVDLDGNVWVASSTTATISKIKGSDGELLATIGVGDGPIGVGIDAWGNGWAVSRVANTVTRINGLDMSDTFVVPVGLGPYSYSDMLGLSLRTITHQNDGFAWWLGNVDSGMESPDWLSINWVADAPDGTRVEARFRCHENEEELATASWGESLTEPGEISCPTGGRYGQVEIRMYAAGTARSPVLESVTLYWE
ncbi:MAG: hypothetical protein JRF33_12115 [Deltaproteobacteria bacterium]|nr:hypothetical protein [Deltaproteobacteria bacterium]